MNRYFLSGKVAGLSFLKEQGVSVPDFFVVPPIYFAEYISHNNLDKLIVSFLNNTKKDINELKKIQNLIRSGKFPSSIKKFFENEFNKTRNDLYAIRSSSAFEDSKKNSYAGHFDTYLKVKKRNVLKYTKYCWASAFNINVLQYAKTKDDNYSYKNFSVIVQKMILPKISGVIFSVNPINNNKKEVVIEYTQGSGDLLMQGILSPTRIFVNKNNFSYANSLSKLVKNQNLILQKKEIKEIVIITIKLEKKLKKPCDIEWVFDGKKIYFLQCRPITTK